MAWRSLHISQAAKLSLQQGQLSVEQVGVEAISLPVEDLTTLVLESPQITLTSALLARLQGAGVAVMVCDAQHLPVGLMLPFHQHSRQSEVASLQIASTQPFRKRCWQRVVQQKLRNQADCLRPRAAPQAQTLHAMASRVQSGDTGNLEAVGAKLYWSALMPESFRRGQDCIRNAALNYGYAIVRAAVARGAVAAGLLPCLGLHHASQLNPFNLVDDLMEPLRPYADWVVVTQLGDELQGDSLTKEHRQQLASLLHTPVRWQNTTETLMNTAELMAASLVRAMRAGDANQLLLPNFVPS